MNKKQTFKGEYYVFFDGDSIVSIEGYDGISLLGIITKRKTKLPDYFSGFKKVKCKVTITPLEG